MASRIAYQREAFANAPAKGQKRPRKEDGAHLKWIRTLPCAITGRRPVEAAHVRYEDPAYAKRETGKAEKPDDRWSLPLSPEKHREQHSMAERAFWAKHGIDPLRVALALYNVTGDDEQGELIIRNARRA
ncbi:DUF968 domain-containing protein [Mesorhizobium sp. M1B.F.Ca.ET.045.04.1.1]|uniref:DUF968 domain-containing protein n=1 Tax=Mesorhizobium sp. M1B.F.Ca.ET.045.04.1.1 TaxID=2493673 RepID=UPI000F753024|nr:DUF968 domain-containing protein [Mesorhizobium sp. M1B.F.Ca.ET.045.04.1.1]AZO29296.1 DUF968 domain-containing protein [Mesorhizobium sp. M1B.F.Ca.ET.045.04.1.1]